MIISNRTLVFIWPARIRNFGNARGAGCDLMPGASEICVADVEISIQDDRNHRFIKKLEIHFGFAATVLDQLRSTNLGSVNVLVVIVILKHGDYFRECSLGYEDYSHPVMDMATRNMNRVIVFPGM